MVQSTPVPDAHKIKYISGAGTTVMESKAWPMAMLKYPCTHPNTNRPTVDGTSSFLVLARRNSLSLWVSRENQAHNPLIRNRISMNHGYSR